MLTFCLFIIAIISYLLGAVNGSIIASKYFFKKDIRDFGSGNAGLTNFYRIFGKTGVIVVLVIDIAKTALAVFLGWLLMKGFGFEVEGKLFAGFFVMLGHAFPIYYGFKGGKGVLCGGILVLMLDWRIGLLCWLVFIIAVAFTRYVSLGSICAGIMLPIGIAVFDGWWLEVVLGLMCGLLLVIMHRQNLLRLIGGKERKLSFGQGGSEDTRRRAPEQRERRAATPPRERAQTRPRSGEDGKSSYDIFNDSGDR